LAALAKRSKQGQWLLNKPRFAVLGTEPPLVRWIPRPNLADNNRYMPRDRQIFDHYDISDERPTGNVSTSFGSFAGSEVTTAPAAWRVSEHSTFNVPSRSIDTAPARRRHEQLKTGLFALAFLAVTITVCTVALVMWQ
jgi:hypothetical protein